VWRIQKIKINISEKIFVCNKMGGPKSSVYFIVRVLLGPITHVRACSIFCRYKNIQFSCQIFSQSTVIRKN
jgi:hypothetical protein